MCKRSMRLSILNLIVFWFYFFFKLHIAMDSPYGYMCTLISLKNLSTCKFIQWNARKMADKVRHTLWPAFFCPLQVMIWFYFWLSEVGMWRTLSAIFLAFHCINLHVDKFFKLINVHMYPYGESIAICLKQIIDHI
jgi:hypothetical protein